MQSESPVQMKSLKELIRNSLTAATPKPYQNRTQALFQSIDSFIRFNDKGEIYTKDNEEIPGSHMEDLINYAVRDRRRNIVPVGSLSSLIYLREHNIPKSILNRSIVDELEGELTLIIRQEMKTTLNIKMHESRPREVSPSHPTVQRAVRIKPHRKRHREASPPQRAAKKAALHVSKNYNNE